MDMFKDSPNNLRYFDKDEAPSFITQFSLEP